MNVDLSAIEAMLLGETVVVHPDDGELLNAIRRVIEDLYKQQGSSKLDLANLIRQALRFRDARVDQQRSKAVLRSRKINLLPSKAEWERCGLYIVKEDHLYYHLQALPWRPSWLAVGDPVPEGAAFSYAPRRKHKEAPADPFLIGNTPFNAYNNFAQREAVRALLTMPKGSTLCINLPTGSGKSLCAWLPAALGQGLVVVVVPTVALALDQEKALLGQFNMPLAYHGGDDPTSVQKRETIRENVRRNEQRVLITSPESLATSLFAPVLSAARQGSLTHLVIDEAHMVYEWGNSFRPAFQKLAGIRRALLRHSENRLKTVLLSATLTAAALSLVKTLFSEPGPFQVFSSMQLRPEPSYWFLKCQEEEKRKYILDAVHHLPRPLILYTTKVQDAQQLYHLIQAQGYTRIGLLTGSSTTQERSVVIEGWKSGFLDLVVGTAAFGLGIDKANVRSVVHACVAESVDRYYQEVGRGGRDGKACLSLVIYTEQDVRDAESLSKEKLISEELGWQRWSNLFTKKIVLGERHYKVNLTERRNISLSHGDYNEGWNLKTLLLMVQSQMIALDEEQPTYAVASNQDDSDLSDAACSQVIEILDIDHFQENHWKKKIRAARDFVVTESRRAMQSMVDLLTGSRCVGLVLKEFYSNGDISAMVACGGCPACRRENKAPFSGILPIPPFQWKHYETALQGDLHTEFQHTRQLILFYKPEDFTGVKNLIQWAARMGVVAFFAPSSYLPQVSRMLSGERQPAALFPFEEFEFAPPLPRMILCPPGNNQLTTTMLHYCEHVPSLLILPYTMKQPESAVRYVRQMAAAPTRTIDLQEFVTKYGIV